MVVGTLSLKLLIRNSCSLKDKRQVLKSLKDRIRNKFNISVAEVDYQDIWQTAALGIAAVSNNTRFVNSVLSEIINFIRQDISIQLINYEQEVL